MSRMRSSQPAIVIRQRRAKALCRSRAVRGEALVHREMAANHCQFAARRAQNFRYSPDRSLCETEAVEVELSLDYGRLARQIAAEVL